MTNATDHGLGRRIFFDERSRNFPIRALISTAAVPRSYTWSCGVQLDQGSTGCCVGFSWAAELAARPVVVPSITNQTGLNIYKEAVKIDPWPENDGPDLNFGTSVLAGVKTLQAKGYVQEYRWAFGIEDVLLSVGYKGPCVLGIPWYAGMDHPDPITGIISPSGFVRGGHAILANGVSVSKRLVRLHNSWGKSFGLNGDCFISFDDLAGLLAQQGEACVPVRRSQP